MLNLSIRELGWEYDNSKLGGSIINTVHVTIFSGTNVFAQGDLLLTYMANYDH